MQRHNFGSGKQTHFNHQPRNEMVTHQHANLKRGAQNIPNIFDEGSEDNDYSYIPPRDKRPLSPNNGPHKQHISHEHHRRHHSHHTHQTHQAQPQHKSYKFQMDGPGSQRDPGFSPTRFRQNQQQVTHNMQSRCEQHPPQAKSYQTRQMMQKQMQVIDSPRFVPKDKKAEHTKRQQIKEVKSSNAKKENPRQTQRIIDNNPRRDRHIPKHQMEKFKEKGIDESKINKLLENPNFLGMGSYGVVMKRNGSAVKKFQTFPEMLQEYLGCKFFQDSPYVVSVTHVDFMRKELHMEIYTQSLKIWLIQYGKMGNMEMNKIVALKDVLQGLVWFEDNGMAHGDFKPGNILCNWNQNNGSIRKSVIADCGFVAPQGYSKSGRTAPVYREVAWKKDLAHDIYSLGVMLIEMFGNHKFKNQENHEVHQRYAKRLIKDDNIKEIALKCLSENRNERPSPRYILSSLFGMEPGSHKCKLQTSPYGGDGYRKILSESQQDMINREIRKNVPGITRPDIAFLVAKDYIQRKSLDEKNYTFVISVSLMMVTSIYGPQKFDLKAAWQYSLKSELDLSRLLKVMSEDRKTMCILFSKRL